jgi:hypothetical protein
MSQSDSVLFSLQELARMEEDRVRELAVAARELREREEEQRGRAHRQRLAEQRVREQAEALEREERSRRAREEEARIEAVHRAAVETARIETEARVRAQERERERSHQLEIERERAHARGMRQRTAMRAALAGFAVAAAAAAATVLGVVAPRERALSDQILALYDSRDTASRDARANAEATERTLHTLQENLAALRSDRDRLQSDLDDARRQLLRRSGAFHGPSAGPHSTGDRPKLDGFTSCPPGSKDPMCLQ